MQPATSHQLMGYDRAISIFSPDGRLLQVEYAKKTVKQGSTVVGLTTKDAVVIIADKRLINSLVVKEAIHKITKVDKHIVASAAGIISDARVLISYAQKVAQQHRVTYDSPIDIVEIVRSVGDVVQVFTQSGGLRPFGVSLMLGGYDQSPKLFIVDPTGIYFQYKACSIGEGEDECNAWLQKNYKPGLSVNDALKIGITTLKRFLKGNFSVERLEIVVVTKQGVRFLPMEEINKITKKI